MKHWKALAPALDPPVPADALDRVIPVLEGLESALRPLAQTIPIDTLPWSGPGDTE
jgi:hypothetical protein